MRVLAAIANHGHGNRQYLDRLLAEYRAMPHDVDVVVLSNIPKDVGPDVEVRVGLPTRNPWSLPFGHKQLFAERIDDYDLFIYSEDDILVTARNIDAFVEVTPTLKDDEIAGFMRVERYPDGAVSYDMVHSFYRWDPASVRERDGQWYAWLSNEHAAAYILTRDHLRRAIDSGGFLVPPHEHRYDLLCTAATDPYTQCGMTKLICLTRLADFEVLHLPNKYLGVYGIDADHMAAQVDELCRLGREGKTATPLFEVETKLPGSHGSKPVHGLRDDALLELVPASDKSVLVLGAGAGATEGALVEAGHRVTALPVDPVLGRSLALRGVEVVAGDWGEAEQALADASFDCVILPEVLHLVPEPESVLALAKGVLAPGGRIITTLPNTAELKTRIRRWRGEPGYRELGRFAETGLHHCTRATIRRWFEAAGLTVGDMHTAMTPKRAKMNRASAGLGKALLADRWLVIAAPGPGDVPSSASAAIGAA